MAKTMIAMTRRPQYQDKAITVNATAIADIHLHYLEMILTLPVLNPPFKKTGKERKKDGKKKPGNCHNCNSEEHQIKDCPQPILKRRRRRIRSSSFTESQQRRPRWRKSMWRP
jgi:hypothetical protein